jgi:hypothetical protein
VDICIIFKRKPFKKSENTVAIELEEPLGLDIALLRRGFGLYRYRTEYYPNTWHSSIH